jgi:RNA recognition motif-containing protein
MVAVKIKGLEYGVNYNEIKNFFNGFGYINNSVQLGLNREGRNNGFGAILMDNSEAAEGAVKEKNGKYIGDRWVELTVISYGEYREFNSEKYTGSKGTKFGGETVKLSQCVNDDNEDRALVLRGCPYESTKDEILNFVKDFGKIGKKTGSCLVVFENE